MKRSKLRMRFFMTLALILIFIFVFSSSDASAATQSCTNSNQIIFSLYDDHNSHGAVATGGVASGADYKICYEKIFSAQYAGANPSTCKAGDANKVLRLSADSNAHAQKFELGTYSTKICYGDLICRATTGSCDTANPDPVKREAPVVYLSSDSNAHIGAPSVSSAYQWKICCASPSNPPAGNIPPLVSITSPADGARFASSLDITIEAIATDSDGSISKVEFYKDSTDLLGSSTSGISDKFSIVWKSPPIGKHDLTAIAYDNRGAQTISSEVTVYIETSPPVSGTFCGDGIVQKPNDQGVNEICDWRDQTTCPANQLCVSEGAEACKSCFDYKKGCEQFNSDLSKCEGNEQVAKNSIGYDETGGTCPTVSFKCTVDSGVCKAVKMEDYINCGRPELRNCPLLSCVAETTSLGECAEGYRTITIKYKQVGGSMANCPTCKSEETKKIPCGRNVAFLPFIGILQIIAAIIAIGVIYYLMFSRKRKKGKKR